MFVPVWLLVSTANLWVGVSRAGYSVRDELPVLVVELSVPSIAAAIAIALCARV